MAIAYVAVGARANTSSATSRAPALPTRSNGDFLICMVGSKNNATHSVSGTGWTKLTQVNSGADWTVSLCTCVVNGSEATPTVSWTGAVAAFGHVIGYSGASVNPIGATNSNTGTTSTHSCTAVTTTRANSLVIYLDGAAENTSLATPSGWTENADSGSATGATRDTQGSKTVASIGTSGDISVTGANAAWVMWQIELRESPTSLTATSQSYTVTANAVGMTIARAIAVSSQSYTQTNNAVNLARGRTLAITSQNYTVTANNVGLFWKRVLSVASQSYTVTAQAISPLWNRILSAVSQSYEVTAQSASLLWNHLLSITSQSYEVTGQPIAPLWKRLLSVASQSFTVTGNDVTLTKSGTAPSLTVDTQSYTVTGNDVALLATRQIQISSVSYSVTGNAIGLAKTYALPVVEADYSLTGSNVGLSHSYTLPVSSQPYDVTMQAVGFIRAYIIAVARANYAATFTDISFIVASDEYSTGGIVYSNPRINSEANSEGVLMQNGEVFTSSARKAYAAQER